MSSQIDHSNPPPPAPTNPTFSPRSPKYPNSLRILQWNSGGLSSSQHAKLCSFPPNGTIWRFSKRLIFPALRTLKFQATLSSELIVPSLAVAQPPLETRMVGEFPLWSTQTSPFEWSPSLPSPTQPQTISVSKSTSKSNSFSSSMSTPLPSETLKSTSHLLPWTSPELLWHLYSRWFQCPSPHLRHTHLSRQCWQFPIQLDLILSARHPQRPWHSHAAPPLLWLPLFFSSSGGLSRCPTGLVPSHLAPTCEWRTLPGLGSDHLPIDINLQFAPIHHTNTRLIGMNSKNSCLSTFLSYRGNAEYPLRSSILLITGEAVRLRRLNELDHH